MKKIVSLVVAVTFVILLTTGCGSGNLKGYWELKEKKNFDGTVTSYKSDQTQYLEITKDQMITSSAASGIVYAKIDSYYLAKKDAIYYADKKIKDSKNLDSEIKKNEYAGKLTYEIKDKKLITTETYEDKTKTVLTYERIEKDKMPQQ